MNLVQTMMTTTIQTTYEPTHFSQLECKDEVLVANKFLTMFWRTNISSVLPSLDPLAVIVNFHNARNLPSIIAKNNSLNKGNIIQNVHYSNYIVATSKENFQKATLERLNIRKRKFNEKLLEIKLKPTLVGTKELSTSTDNKTISSMRLLDLMEIRLHSIYFSQEVGKQELKDKFLLEEKHGIMHYAYAASIAPLMTLDHADENFFREARQLFKKQQHEQVKWIDEFLEDTARQYFFPIY